MPSLIATAVVGAGIGGALIAGNASQDAASTQAAAATNAQQIQAAMYAQTRADLSPFTRAGLDATKQISDFSPFNFNPTQAQLEATPGYQFNLNQGLKSVQNSYAARGLGTSGAAMKGAASYATGLADSTYQNQFANALTSYTTNLSRLQNLSNLGENAAAQTGAYGTATAQGIGQAAVGAANATAAGTIGAANAAVGGLNSASSGLLLNRFLGGGSGIYAPSPVTGTQGDLLGTGYGDFGSLFGGG